MSTKNKPVPYIDAQTTSSTTAPNVRKVKFNPYTGGIISTGGDKPTFGKYTMELRSGNFFDSRVISFKKIKTGATWSYLNTELPIPQVKLLVTNPNYEIVDSIVFLAFTEEALAGVDNGGNFDQTERQASPEDYYISFSPEKNTPIIKRTVVLELYDDIVRLFQKYTIYELLEIITGADYTAITNDSQLITILQANLSNLRLWAEAGFNNDADSTDDGYFIRNKIAARFVFDKAYLGNPKLKDIVVNTDTDSINITVNGEALRSISFNIYAGTNTTFDYETETPVKSYTVDISKKVNPVISIPITSIPAPRYNNLADFTTNRALDEIINSRKVFAVKVTKVVVSSGIEKLESTFLNFFKINPALATTKVKVFEYNIPAPTLATFITATNFPKPAYFLNLLSNCRVFYFRIEQPVTGPFNPAMPSGIKGILLKYLNDKTTVTDENSMRFYALTDTDHVSLVLPGFIPTGTSTVYYYYRVIDFYKEPSSAFPAFQLDIPFPKSRIVVYTVNNYYYPSASPLVLTTTKYDVTNYFNLPGNAFLKIDNAYRLQYASKFLLKTPRLNLRFKIEYATAKVVTEAAPPANTVWKLFPGTYKFVYEHGYAAIVKPDNTAVLVQSDGENPSGANINLTSAFSNVKAKQAVWFRFVLVEGYKTDKEKPYSGTTLAVLKKYV